MSNPHSELVSGKPGAADLASLDAYRTYYRRMWYGDIPWTPGPEAELRDIVRIEANGRIQPVPYGAALEAFSGMNVPAHNRVIASRTAPVPYAPALVV